MGRRVSGLGIPRPAGGCGLTPGQEHGVVPELPAAVRGPKCFFPPPQLFQGGDPAPLVRAQAPLRALQKGKRVAGMSCEHPLPFQP